MGYGDTTKAPLRVFAGIPAEAAKEAETRKAREGFKNSRLNLTR
jgi:hypothetical protein